MIEVLDNMKSVGAMTTGAVVGHLASVGIRVTSLTIRFFVICGHVFEDFVNVARRARYVAMFSSEFELSALIVIELNPRKAGCYMAERAFLVDLPPVMGVSVTVRAFLVRNFFESSGIVAFVAIEHLVLA